jgi:hypothetical protein
MGRGRLLADTSVGELLGGRGPGAAEPAGGSSSLEAAYLELTRDAVDYQAGGGAGRDLEP